MDLSNITIFGASGFLGKALVARIIKDRPKATITCVARNEGQLVALKEQFPSVTILVGDISDPWIVKQAMVFADEVHILAAMKHVGLAEAQVRSCINSNIVGLMNIIQESFIVRPRLVMFISSDKAATGTGIYGMSKKIGERLMNEASEMNFDTRYRVVRYGNVLYSTQSVLCKWRDRMQKGEEIIVTDPESTRFYWSVDQALDLIFKCIETSDDASPCITPMKSMRLGDLLEAMMSKYGRVPVKTIGLQIGENMHEVIAEGIPDSFHSERFTKEEIFNLI
jgi:UDP-N-acetylglucosamine 4,6-dehydratase/5-epimerase